MILESLLASVIAPAAIDGLKNLGAALTRKWAGLSVDDEIKLGNAQVEKLKALAQLDTPVGTPSQWVIDLRASFRYIAAGVSILAGIGIVAYVPFMAEVGAQLITMPFGFIFGERMYLTISGKNK